MSITNEMVDNTFEALIREGLLEYPLRDDEYFVKLTEKGKKAVKKLAREEFVDNYNIECIRFCMEENKGLTPEQIENWFYKDLIDYHNGPINYLTANYTKHFHTETQSSP